jgi:hypothetical protein
MRLALECDDAPSVGRPARKRFIGGFRPNGEVSMKNILLAAVICIAVTYAVDAYWFNGAYYGGLSRMFTSMRPYLP